MKGKQNIFWLLAIFILTNSAMSTADDVQSFSYKQNDSTETDDGNFESSDDEIDYLIESKKALRKRLAIEQFEREEAAKRERRRKRWMAKEKIFKKFYTADNECHEVIWWSIRVDCTNEKIKARKKFEKLYKKGSVTLEIDNTDVE